MTSVEVSPPTKECNNANSVPVYSATFYFEKEKAMKALRTIQHRFRTKKISKISILIFFMHSRDIGYSYANELHKMFAKGEILPYEDVCFIINRSIFLYSQIGSINHLYIDENELNEDITIVGDLHGQLEDLFTIFLAKCIPTPTHTFVFNGDYIDRGSNSIEILLLTLYYKLLLPNNIYHNKGNHETKFCQHHSNNNNNNNENNIENNNENNNNINKGDFELEILKKYPSHYDELIRLFTNLFDSFPICTAINDQVLIVHGGISEDIKNINEIAKVQKNDYNSNIMTELMWNDPKENMEGFEFNKKRNIGKLFGKDVSESFCKNNNLKYIIRSHQYCEDGLKILHNNRIITLFSASYYCGNNKNQGAIIIISSSLDPISIQYYSDKNLYHNFYKIPTIEEYIIIANKVKEEEIEMKVKQEEEEEEEIEKEEMKEKIIEKENEMIKKMNNNIGRIYYVLSKYDRYSSGFIEKFDLLFLLYKEFDIVLNIEIENSSMFMNYELV